MNDEELINIINKAAFEVRKNLTYGYLESVYQNALLIELRNAGLKAETEVPLNVIYKNNVIGSFKADIIVENTKSNL